MRVNLKYDLKYKTEYGSNVCYYISPEHMNKEIGGLYINKRELDMVTSNFRSLNFKDYPNSITITLSFDNDINENKNYINEVNNILNKKHFAIQPDFVELHFVIQIEKFYNVYSKYILIRQEQEYYHHKFIDLYILHSELNFLNIQSLFLIITITKYNYY